MRISLRQRLPRQLWLGWLGVTMAVLLGSRAMAQVGVPRMAAMPSAAQLRPLVFDGVTVIDVTQGRRVPAQRVLIIGNRIRSMGRAQTVPLPAGAQVVDARGKYLIPGLWDMHTHSQRATEVFYPEFLANGVTGIRDAWSEVPLDTLNVWRREILAGKRVGPPRQLFVGAALDEAAQCTARGNGHLCVNGSDTADVRYVVDSLKAVGADMIKTYDLDHDTYFMVAAEARRIGIPFGGHLRVATAIEASDSGARILDHFNSAGDLDEACLPGAQGMNMATVADCQALAAHFQRNNTWWCPTLVASEENGATTIQAGPAARAILARLKAVTLAVQSDTVPRVAWLRWLREPPLPLATGGTVSGPPGVASAGILRLVYRVALPIVAGTDVTPDVGLAPGFMLHAELATYVAEGLSPLEALQTATLNPAKMWHATDSLGTVAPGKLADLVLLDADPLVDITNTTTIRAVVANGRYYDRAALDHLLATVQATAHHEP